MNRAERYGKTRDIAVELASRPEGMSNAAFRAATGIEHNNCGTRIARMCQLGHIHQARANGMRLRWFDTAKRAEAWVAANGGPPAGPSPQALAAEKRARTVDEPVTIHKRAAFDTNEVDDSRAKLTLCPSPGYDARYQLPPGTRVMG